MKEKFYTPKLSANKKNEDKTMCASQANTIIQSAQQIKSRVSSSVIFDLNQKKKNNLKMHPKVQCVLRCIFYL